MAKNNKAKKSATLARLPLSIEQLSFEANARLVNKQFNCARYLFLQSGVVAIITEQGRYLVPPEHGILLPANTVFQLLATTSSKAIFYTFDNLKEKEKPTETAVLEASDFLKSLINESISEHINEYESSALLSLQQLLVNRIKAAKPLSLLLPAVKDQRLVAITSRQQKFPALKTDLVGWGKFVHASPRTLTRVFKNETGITYSEWKQIMAIHIAIIELYLGVSISMIAKNLGYESSSAFIYMFRKHMKVTPSNYLAS